ncbi:DUF1833 domain-containing protein [Rhodanobacter glycinis]|uniref:DUF1833 family protein n=1 Tax=Rhodanobacter glycinis TaxID=582702 RepID=UPI00112B46EA|nr:DUF1833 family protein [Rhodanobacter glycinis]TPG50672.1 DUF1833 domain-containing protein [Rhodanobacter glycinis]
MRVVSVNALRAMLAQETAEVFLCCITITHPAIVTQRLVNNPQALVRSAGTYTPCPMQMTLPAQRSDQIPQVNLVIDNVDRTVLEQIRTVAGIPQVTMEVVLASSPDVVEAGPFDFSLLVAAYDVMVLTGTIGYADDVLNQKVPAMEYTPTNSPGLFL